MKHTYASLPFGKRNLYFLVITWALIMPGAVECYAQSRGKTPEAYEQTVEAHFDRKEWTEGMELLKEGLKLYPESSELNGLAGTYYYRQQDYDNARYFLVRAVRESPDNVTAKSLLITVEEQTGNYSSAICYVNELLEITPYWPGLWKRKIGLYRKQGNDVEADRLLKRLFEIYPEDSIVRKDYVARLEENYLRERRNGNRAAAVQNLRELLKNDRSEETYYLDLANLLLQEGDPDAALRTISEGVQTHPRSEALTAKKAEILAGQQRYPEALAFLDERKEICRRSIQLQKLRDAIVGDYARHQRASDPYRLYGTLYDRNHDPEALDYLLDEALRSGRDEDARRYISEMRRTRGESTELDYKEYLLYKRADNPKAFTLLQHLYETDPTNTEIAEELCIEQYRRAETLLRDNSYDEALESLAFVAAHTTEPDLRMAALRKSHSTLLLLRRSDEARLLLEKLKPHISREEWLLRTAETEVTAENTAVALDILYASLHDTTAPIDTERIRSTYEEIAIPYLKGLIEAGDLRNACRESQRAVTTCPGSDLLLQYAITSHTLCGNQSAADDYIRRGLEQFPDNPTFVTKMAATMYSKGQYREAVALLLPHVDSLRGNRELITSLSAHSEALARQRIKANNISEALSGLDIALTYDPSNRTLLLTKGQAYEKEGRYDSAYRYQSLYQPEPAEARSFKRHLTALQYRGLRNELSLGLLVGGYINGDAFEPVTEITYAHTTRHNRFYIAPSYTAHEREIDTENENLSSDGGQGIRIVAGWEHRFARKWELTLAAGWANDFFPKVTTDASLTRDLPRDWSLGLNLGFRSLTRDQIVYRWEETQNETTGTIQGEWIADHNEEIDDQLYNAGLTAIKSFESLVLTLKGEAFVLGGNLYANGSAQLKYLPGDDGISFLRGSVGIGTAPELDVIDRALPGCFSRLNFTAGFGGGYLIGKHLILGIDLTFNALYTEDGIRVGSYDNFTDDVRTEYKNTLNANIYATFRF